MARIRYTNEPMPIAPSPPLPRSRAARTFRVFPHILTTLAAVAVVTVTASCASSPAPGAVAPTSPAVTTQPQVFSPSIEGTPRELMARGEKALMTQSWREAADAFEALLAAEPNSATTPTVLLDLGLAYEGLGEREKARDRYHELATRFPDAPVARTALVNATEIHAYLEEWAPLSDTAKALLARKDIDDVDRMTALGARGLAEVEQGDLDGGARDIENGLDIMERNHYGALNRLPVAAAQLRFALGELRKARSEKVPLTSESGQADPTFLLKIEQRCSLLLSAQNAYADAIRSIDPHWAAMSGYRVGEMYRVLHHELMSIPPVAAAKSDRQKQLHYGMMHVRYRVLLEKGLEMMRRTLELGAKTSEASVWMKRAEDAKKEMELALADEKEQIAKLPFTEDELQRALDILEKKTTGRVSSQEPPPPPDKPGAKAVEAAPAPKAAPPAATAKAGPTAPQTAKPPAGGASAKPPTPN